MIRRYPKSVITREDEKSKQVGIREKARTE